MKVYLVSQHLRTDGDKTEAKEDIDC